jgi:hypothetical protein
MSESRRLLTRFESMNGLLLFGISAAILFAELSHLVRLRPKKVIRAQPRPESALGGIT